MSQPESDDLEACIERARRGERGAIEQMLTAHLADLQSYVRLRASDALRTRDSTSDFVQSVCREVLENLPGPRFENAAAFREWLYRAAEHKIIDRARYWNAERRAPERRIDAGEALEGEIGASGAAAITPSHAASVREELVQVEHALASLSAPQREVILLARFARLSMPEVAQKLGKSEGAVRTMLSRALAELSERLA